MRIYNNQENKNNVQARSDLKSIYGQDFENGYPNKLFADFENEMSTIPNQLTTNQ